jgi:hypothetical protein
MLRPPNQRIGWCDLRSEEKERALFEDIDLTGVGCRRNYMEVRISAVDMFVSSTWGYGKEVGQYIALPY